MSDLNRCTIVGRLTRDPERNGSAIKISLACNRKYKEVDETTYVDCVAFGKTGEVIEQYMKKGQRVGIDGRIKQNRWEDKDGNKRSKIEIVIDNFQFLDSKAETSNDIPF